jgi:hypothetical protein
VSLYDTSVDLMVKLEAASSADTSDELLARASTIALTLNEIAIYLEGVAQFRSEAHIASGPKLDSKQVAQTLRSFRSGLSKYGAAAMQHQPANSLLAVAKTQKEQTARWVRASWKHLFAESEPLLALDAAGDIVGDGNKRLAVRTMAARLRAAGNLDPISDTEDLLACLGGSGASEWIAKINSTTAELQVMIAELERGRSALTPQVQELLRRAATTAGVPLAELTPELHAQLKESGTEDDLVVRRS